MRDPKEPGDNYNMKEHVYHDSNIVQGLPDKHLQIHMKDSKQKISNKSKKNSKKNVPDKQAAVKKNPYAEPYAHQTKETSKDVKQKSKDSSAARSSDDARGSPSKHAGANENIAPKRRELISSPQGIDVDAVPISVVENETGESSGIQLISKKDLNGVAAAPPPTRTPTVSALTRNQTWKNEDSFNTTRNAVVVTKPRKQPPEIPREVKHFRRNALIITLFLLMILTIVAIVVVCLIVLK